MLQIASIMNPRYGTQNPPTSILKVLYVSTHIIIYVYVSDILFTHVDCGVFPCL